MTVLLVLILLALLWPGFVRGIFKLIALVAVAIIFIGTFAQKPTQGPNAISEPVAAATPERVAAAPTKEEEDAREKAFEQKARDTQASIITKASAVAPFVITMDAILTGGRRPMIYGTTNLPDGTQLVIILYKPFLPNPRARLAAGLETCAGGSCPLLQDGGNLGIEIKNGRFQAGPFSSEGDRPLAPGTYSIVVMGAFNWLLQPPEVLSILGLYGENAKGPLMDRCCFGTLETPAEVQAKLEKIKRERFTLSGGSYFEYGRYVGIE